MRKILPRPDRAGRYSVRVNPRVYGDGGICPWFICEVREIKECRDDSEAVSVFEVREFGSESSWKRLDPKEDLEWVLQQEYAESKEDGK